MFMVVKWLKNSLRMSSSTPEILDSESDSENINAEKSYEPIDIMSSSGEGEPPSDHTYTKEPGCADESSKNLTTTDMDKETEKEAEDSSSLEKSRPLRSKKYKAPTPEKKSSAKATKVPLPKKWTPSMRNKSKKVKAAASKAEEAAPNGEVDEKETNSTTEEEPKPTTSKRGRKRKAEKEEAKETVRSMEDSEGADSEETKKSPKKQAKERKQRTEKMVVGSETSETANLPKGWTREVITRKTGKTAGLVDVYIFSPDGLKFRSRPSLASYLLRTKSLLKIENFDFSKHAAPSSSSPKTTLVKAPKPKASPTKDTTRTPKKSSTLLLKMSPGGKGEKEGTAKESPKKGAKEDAKGRNAAKASKKEKKNKIS